jgi:hypothetical protein
MEPKTEFMCLVPVELFATFCVDAIGTGKKSRLYTSLAKNQYVGRKRKLAALRQWFATLSTEPMIF